MAPHWDCLSCWKDQFRICQSTKCADREAQKIIMLSWRCTLASMSKWYSVSGWCSLLPPGILRWNHQFGPKCLLVSTGETNDGARGPTCSLCHKFLLLFKRHYWLRLASLRLKLTLGSSSFARCWNVSLLRLRTLVVHCQDCKKHASIHNIKPWSKSP